MTANLESLLERVRNASAGDRRLEADIVAAFYNDKEAATHEDHDLAMHRYLSSVDAALALVERVLPGWAGQFYWSGNGALCALEKEEPWANAIWGFSASTRPLAILSALLQALISTGAK